MARSFGRSLQLGVATSTPWPYLTWMYRTAMLLMVIIILIMQLEVHGQALGSKTTETVANLGQLLALMLVTLLVLYPLDVATKALYYYSEQDRNRMEVSDVE